MIACALSAGYKVFKTSGNSNSQIGVPLTLLKMSPDDQIAVIEMGMSMRGEMSRLSELVELDDAVITNIGVSHIEQLKTKDGICEENSIYRMQSMQRMELYLLMVMMRF